jgi:hypothetical protein
MSSKNSVAKSLKLVGNVTMAHIKDVNKSGGSQWLSAINIKVTNDLRGTIHPRLKRGASVTSRRAPQTLSFKASAGEQHAQTECFYRRCVVQ